MLRRLKLKLYGRYRIPGTKLDADVSKTASPESFRNHPYYTEEVICQDCGALFISSAREKQIFFEERKGNIHRRFCRCRPCDKIRYPERYSNENG